MQVRSRARSTTVERAFRGRTRPSLYSGSCSLQQHVCSTAVPRPGRDQGSTTWIGRIPIDQRIGSPPAMTEAIPVAILTSSQEERDLVIGYHFGVGSYIQKRVDFIEFRETVRQPGLY